MQGGGNTMNERNKGIMPVHGRGYQTLNLCSTEPTRPTHRLDFQKWIAGT
ncbi:hypothetical protein LCGC14_1295160 [marine sediment metagenome]|uniref:Uncharacterized protein n=1 Tax=marine sediment metagenome TaxID=412755 RepID=A0A0F9KRI8_9ZZZZ